MAACHRPIWLEDRSLEDQFDTRMTSISITYYMIYMILYVF